MESKLKKMSTNGITLIAPVNEAFSSLNKTVVDFLKSPKVSSCFLSGNIYCRLDCFSILVF